MDSSLSALHVLHLLRIRLCWQMLAPPHSLHVLLLRACWQMLAPPHSLHPLLLRACQQMLDPAHSLHRLLCRLCWQMLAPSPIVLTLLRLPLSCSLPSPAAPSPPRRCSPRRRSPCEPWLSHGLPAPSPSRPHLHSYQNMKCNGPAARASSHLSRERSLTCHPAQLLRSICLVWSNRRLSPSHWCH